jgi:nucleoside-diphosphate-sugar epimerase
LKDAAEAVKRFIPDAQITFGDEPENCELPWLVNCDRARDEVGWVPLSLDEAVVMHAKEARRDAGLPPLKP